MEVMGVDGGFENKFVKEGREQALEEHWSLRGRERKKNWRNSGDATGVGVDLERGCESQWQLTPASRDFGTHVCTARLQDLLLFPNLSVCPRSG